MSLGGRLAGAAGLFLLCIAISGWGIGSRREDLLQEWDSQADGSREVFNSQGRRRPGAVVAASSPQAAQGGAISKMQLQREILQLSGLVSQQ